MGARLTLGKGAGERTRCPGVAMCHSSRCQTRRHGRLSTWPGARLFCFCLKQPRCLPEGSPSAQITACPARTDPSGHPAHGHRVTVHVLTALKWLSPQPSLCLSTWLFCSGSSPPYRQNVLAWGFGPGCGPWAGRDGTHRSPGPRFLSRLLIPVFHDSG